MNCLFFRRSKRSTLLTCITLIIVAIIAFIFISNYASNNSRNSHLSVWIEEYILTYNNHKYIVTDQFTDDIGQVIGGVSYHGNKPGNFQLYSINHVEDFSKIAVETKPGYLIAIIKE
jgi:hypothetical protein